MFILDAFGTLTLADPDSRELQLSKKKKKKGSPPPQRAANATHQLPPSTICITSLFFFFLPHKHPKHYPAGLLPNWVAYDFGRERGCVQSLGRLLVLKIVIHKLIWRRRMLQTKEHFYYYEKNTSILILSYDT